MNKIGQDITQAELDEIMRQHDLQHNGVISFTEFKAVFLDMKDIHEAEQF
jgi:Ca2+-binding EF-hand superfamily protein